MFPKNFELQDPSKIIDTEITRVFNHIMAMEHPEDYHVPGPPRLFRMKQWLKDPRKGLFEDAKYTGKPGVRLPKKPGKKVRLPKPDGDEDGAEPKGKKGKRKRATTSKKTVEATRRQPARGKAKPRTAGLEESEAESSGHSDDEPSFEGDETPDDDSDDEDGDDEDDDDEDDDGEDTADDEQDELAEPAAVKPKPSGSHCGAAGSSAAGAWGPAAGNIADDESGKKPVGEEDFTSAINEVSSGEEDTLSTMPIGKGKGKAVAVAPFVPPHVLASYERLLLAPAALPPTSSRLNYLKTLSIQPQYHGLLNRAAHAVSPQQPPHHLLSHRETLQLDVPMTVDGVHPVPWATWQYPSAHLPKNLHQVQKDIDVFLEYLRVGLCRPGESGPSIHRYCIAVGLFLRDIEIDLELPPDMELPKHLPTYFDGTRLRFAYQQEVLDACERSLRLRTDAGPQSKVPVHAGSTTRWGPLATQDNPTNTAGTLPDAHPSDEPTSIPQENSTVTTEVTWTHRGPTEHERSSVVTGQASGQCIGNPASPSDIAGAHCPGCASGSRATGPSE